MINQQTKKPTALTRRALLVSGAVAATIAAFGSQIAVVEASAQALASNDVRPFRVNIPAEALADLNRRLSATRWPEAETVDDRSQGVQLSNVQALVRYWGTEYDWRRAEQKLNSLPQFLTEIDGVDIHFIHVRSPHADAMPLIMTHGWPGSVFELLKVIGPLTDPTAHGGSARDAFHLVLPSIPGFGFSQKPQGTGWKSRSYRSCLGHPDETSWPQSLRITGRRLGGYHFR